MEGGTLIKEGNLDCTGLSSSTNRISCITYILRMALIFKGSCVPLYSSPRTKGTINPGLALLICG